MKTAKNEIKYGIVATIGIGQEIQCLPYAAFFSSKNITRSLLFEEGLNGLHKVKHLFTFCKTFF